VTSPDVLETVPPVDALPGRRARPALAVLIVVVVVAGLVGLRWSQRPTGWVTQQTYYSEKQKVAVPGLDVCVQVELTGMMKYERSAAAEAADRHFRHLVVNDPTIETLYYESCARGADLTYLSKLHADAAAEKTSLTATMTNSLEEERRMDLLLAENDKLSRSNAAELAAERKRSEELAGKATSLEGLVASMESEIASVRDAAAAARQAEENRKLMTDEQRAQAKALADSGVPDKNRIAPAYPFSDLKQKLELPVAGDILRQFGDDEPDADQCQIDIAVGNRRMGLVRERHQAQGRKGEQRLLGPESGCDI